MERSSENQNQKVQNEGKVIFTSEIEIEEEMKEIEKKPKFANEVLQNPKIE
jgi:hypothetical protein